MPRLTGDVQIAVKKVCTLMHGGDTQTRTATAAVGIETCSVIMDGELQALVGAPQAHFDV
jgi:hypothetical protein